MSAVSRLRPSGGTHMGNEYLKEEESVVFLDDACLRGAMFEY